MPIVINEFEVLPQETAPGPGPADGALSAPPPVKLRVQEVEKIVRRLRQRQARIRAH